MLFIYLFNQIIKDLTFNKIKTSIVLLSLIFAVTPFLILLSIAIQGESMIIKDFSKGFSLNMMKVNSVKPLPTLLDDADSYFIKSVEEPFEKKVKVEMGLSLFQVDALYVGRRYFDFHQIKLLKGTLFSDFNYVSDTPICILNIHPKWSDYLQSVFSIGKLIIIDSEPYRLIGYVSTQDVFQDHVPRVFIPKNLYKDEVSRYSYLFEIHDFNKLQLGETILTSLVQRLMDNPRDKSYNIQDQQGRLNSIYAILEKIKFGLTLSVSLCFMVGGFGISNIMFLSVQSRTREIGVLKAIGATKYFVLTQFLMESMIIATIGAILGIILGFFIIFLISLFTVFQFTVSFLGLMMSFFISILLGAVFGFFPAWRAACLSPVEALRYE